MPGIAAAGGCERVTMTGTESSSSVPATSRYPRPNAHPLCLTVPQMTTSTCGSSSEPNHRVELFGEAVEVQCSQMKLQGTAETFPATYAQSIACFKGALTAPGTTLSGRL